METAFTVQFKQMDGRVVDTASDILRFHFFHEIGADYMLGQNDLEHVPVGIFEICHGKLHAGFLFEVITENAARVGDGVR